LSHPDYEHIGTLETDGTVSYTKDERTINALIADCVMAGMARSGSVYQITIPPEVLQRAFDNTVDLLKSQVVVTPA